MFACKLYFLHNKPGMQWRVDLRTERTRGNSLFELFPPHPESQIQSYQNVLAADNIRLNMQLNHQRLKEC